MSWASKNVYFGCIIQMQLAFWQFSKQIFVNPPSSPSYLGCTIDECIIFLAEENIFR